MKKHFTRLNVKDIPPSIAARVREILEVNIPEEADAVSPGTGALYRWVGFKYFSIPIQVFFLFLNVD